MCLGSLRRQDISSHDIDYVEYVGPCLTWGRVLRNCVIWMWGNDIKCKYMLIFPLQNLACKKLTLWLWRKHHQQIDRASCNIVQQAQPARDHIRHSVRGAVGLIHWGLVTHICVIELSRHGFRQRGCTPSLLQIMVCRLTGAKPLSEPILKYC